MARSKIPETQELRQRRIRSLVGIRAARTALGLSQRELASIVGIHFSSLARFESGYLKLKQGHIDTLLGFFAQAGITIEDDGNADMTLTLSGNKLDEILRTDHPHEGPENPHRFRL